MFRLISLFILLISIFSSLARADNIVNLRWSDNKDKLRLVLDMENKTGIVTEMSPDRRSLTIILDKAALRKDPVIRSKLIKYIKPGTRQKKLTLQVYFTRPLALNKHFALDKGASGYSKHREVFDLVPAAGGKLTKAKNIVKKIPPTKKAPKSIIAPRIPVIILDPGHGGKDGGAVSPYSGIYEKNITLAYAKELKTHLEKEYKYKVYLTRSDDSFASLSDRVAQAEKYNPDIFISIHADSELDTRLKGFAIYTLAEQASDREAAKLAQDQEKFEKEYKIAYNGTDENIKGWLSDMHFRANISASKDFAGLLIDEIRNKTNLLKNTHRYARFKILRGNKNNPAVLIELGYLSNVEEERLLSSPAYRQKIVTAIGKAIRKYFERLQ